MEELKACPFCKSNMKIVKEFSYGKHGYVLSHETQSTIFCEMMDLQPWKNKNKLAKAWNARPIEEALEASVRKLKAELNNASKAGTPYYKERDAMNGFIVTNQLLFAKLKVADEALEYAIRIHDQRHDIAECQDGWVPQAREAREMIRDK